MHELEQSAERSGVLALKLPRRESILAIAATASGYFGITTPTSFAEVAPDVNSIAEEMASLQVTAIQAYRAKDLDTALAQLDRISLLDPSNPVWYERRGQVKVDLKRFAEAIEDFDLAQKLSPENFISLGLLGNRGLAYEGLSLWPEAVRDYTTAIDLGRSVGAEEPYILNSRGNCFNSMGRYQEALLDFQASSAAFIRIRNISGSVYSQSNAALMRAQLGEEDLAVKELKSVARKAAGSIDARAALAAIFWSRGEEEKAEEYWNFACTSINSGIVEKGGPILDGCALYKDMDWLRRIRRWPPVMVEKMDAFINLRSSK
eukprot:CAMPEP_0114252110 /NCGR_PEP_ID=MMETSP0058-20121206/15656_1 /TAXON_ID=36894 /ORGANISM="Pyramimonas parkeae, CCMP726" /LENGTH=318 /DNA_ID=CAMNT_0001366011 /DNA_START=263 /DNA_END=1220 /DNA_ORIENTATION=-